MPTRTKLHSSDGPMSLLWYMLYFSNPKVNMAYQQIQRSFLQRIAPEWFDLKTPFGGVGVAKGDSAPNKYDKLRAVMHHLEHTGQVGDIDEPRKYFRGSLDLKSDLLPDPVGRNGMVCYVGLKNRLRRVTIVVLVGSAKNATGMSDFDIQADITPTAEWDAEAFAQNWSFNMPAVGRTVKDVMKSLSMQFEAIFESGSQDEIDGEVQALLDFAKTVGGFKQRCDFLAKRLHEEDLKYTLDRKRGPIRVHLLVGTPYYVALDE